MRSTEVDDPLLAAMDDSLSDHGAGAETVNKMNKTATGGFGKIGDLFKKEIEFDGVQV